MRRLAGSLLALCALTLAAAPAAGAEFGLKEFDVTYSDQNGFAAKQAGSHPFEMATELRFISEPSGEGGEVTEEAAKDILIAQIPGFVGDPQAAPQCPTAQFLTIANNLGGGEQPDCPDSSALGWVRVNLSSKIGAAPLFGTVFNLEPPPGKAAKLGFWVSRVPITIELSAQQQPPYAVFGGPTNIAQVLEVLGSKLVLWGVPADPDHDELRGRCLSGNAPDGVEEPQSLGECDAGVDERPFLTMPRSCAGPLSTHYMTRSWQSPGIWDTGTHQSEVMKGCGRLGFGPETDAQPTTARAESASGLDFTIEVSDEGLRNPDPEAVAEADITKIVTVLPPGVTANPSAAEGLGYCSEAQFAAASLADPGCPGAAKLGTLEVQTPILEDHTLHGEVYLAQPRANRFGSLFALYFVIADPERGLLFKLPARVDPHPLTGQLITTVEDLPPYPLSRVALHLRSGPRAPLTTPPACGPHTTVSHLTPSSGGPVLEDTSTFQITSGPNGAPCPAGSPFAPGFQAGSQNNAAGHYSPFSMRITRADAEQDITRFSASLPLGVTGKLAGIARCPDAQIAAAKAQSGAAERLAPSCPQSSRIGSVLTGAGVGSSLTYVPGSLYLAGPYNGAPLSVAAIVPAVAGPFDVGTVVVRVALDLNPDNARVEVDGAASDPIPHILEGIPLKVRELRIDTDRPQFTLNPTSCEPMATLAQIGGSGADPFNPSDDALASVSAPHQIASCASLAFRPRLSLALRGKTRRAANTSLRAVLRPREGDANLKGAVVVLPPSQFIDNSHISSPCTRVQFNAGACPKASILGRARAFTPLLEEPLEGPVYFRSNGGERKLPDVVAALRGEIDFNLVIAILQAKNNRVRTKVLNAPDAPVTKFVLRMAGGKKGLLENSEHLCRKKQRAAFHLTGQNGRRHKVKPVIRTSCAKKKKAKKR